MSPESAIGADLDDTGEGEGRVLSQLRIAPIDLT
jgi:hypothetical protein